MMPPAPPARKVSFWTYTALNLMCAIVLVLLAVEVVAKNRIPIADVGAPLGLVLLFFIIPLVAVLLWIRGRKPAGAPPAYFLGSKILWGLTWGISCLPVIFYGAFYFHHMPKPWLSSKQGPDTPEAIAAFNEYFEETIGPDQAHQIYHVLSPELVLFRFEYSDPEVVRKIVAAMKLEPSPNCQLNLAGPPSWWVIHPNKFSCYSYSSNIKWYLSLGVDEKNHRAFYKQFSP